MSNDDDKIDYDEARAAAIEERIERLRRLHGWTTDTVNVKPKDADAMRDDQRRQRTPKASITLTYALPGAADQQATFDESHFDIGSGDRAKLRILHPSLAGRHCRISRSEEGFRVRDMNTQSGTWVNDTRIPLSSPLSNGDVLRCGDIELTIAIGETAAGDTDKKQARIKIPEPAQPPDPVPIPARLKERADKPQGEELGASTMFVSREEVEARSGLFKAQKEAQRQKQVPAELPESTPLPLEAYIVYTDPEGVEREQQIPEDQPLVVGRRSSSDLRLPDSSVSGRHAAFEWVDDDVVVRDLGSTNGTWIDNERVPRAVLKDDDTVRLGLVPVRIRLVFEQVAPVPPPPAAGEPELDEPVARAPRAPRGPQPVVEEGPSSGWHLLYVTDARTLAAASMDEFDNCIVAGEVGCEINVHDRGLKSEHLQFDYTPEELTVMQARSDALLKINGEPVTEKTLEGGEVVSAGSLDIRVVRGVSVEAAKVVGGWSEAYERWARHFERVDPGLELLMVDTEAAGGRTELSLWGDGAARVELYTGESEPERFEATLDPDFLRLLLKEIARAGFPDVPEGAPTSPSGPELHAFIAEERATVVMSDGLAAQSSPWREVRDLLRTVVDHILG